MIDVVVSVAGVIAFLVVAAFASYYLGLWFSRGYHKGKREFVKQVMHDTSCAKKEGV